MTANFDEIFGAFKSFLDSDDSETPKCEQCGFTAAHIKIMCPCGFKFDACAYCASKQRETIKRPFREHAETCKEGQYLITLLGL